MSTIASTPRRARTSTANAKIALGLAILAAVVAAVILVTSSGSNRSTSRPPAASLGVTRAGYGWTAVHYYGTGAPPTTVAAYTPHTTFSDAASSEPATVPATQPGATLDRATGQMHGGAPIASAPVVRTATTPHASIAFRRNFPGR